VQFKTPTFPLKVKAITLANLHPTLQRRHHYALGCFQDYAQGQFGLKERHDNGEMLTTDDLQSSSYRAFASCQGNVQNQINFDIKVSNGYYPSVVKHCTHPKLFN